MSKHIALKMRDEIKALLADLTLLKNPNGLSIDEIANYLAQVEIARTNTDTIIKSLEKSTNINVKNLVIQFQNFNKELIAQEKALGTVYNIQLPQEKLKINKETMPDEIENRGRPSVREKHKKELEEKLKHGTTINEKNKISLDFFGTQKIRLEALTAGKKEITNDYQKKFNTIIGNINTTAKIINETEIKSPERYMDLKKEYVALQTNLMKYQRADTHWSSIVKTKIGAKLSVNQGDYATLEKKVIAAGMKLDNWLNEYIDKSHDSLNEELQEESELKKEYQKLKEEVKPVSHPQERKEPLATVEADSMEFTQKIKNYTAQAAAFTKAMNEHTLLIPITTTFEKINAASKKMQEQNTLIKKTYQTLKTDIESDITKLESASNALPSEGTEKDQELQLVLQELKTMVNSITQIQGGLDGQFNLAVQQAADALPPPLPPRPDADTDLAKQTAQQPQQPAGYTQIPKFTEQQPAAGTTQTEQQKSSVYAPLSSNPPQSQQTLNLQKKLDPVIQKFITTFSRQETAPLYSLRAALGTLSKDLLNKITQDKLSISSLHNSATIAYQKLHTLTVQLGTPANWEKVTEEVVENVKTALRAFSTEVNKYMGNENADAVKITQIIEKVETAISQQQLAITQKPLTLEQAFDKFIANLPQSKELINLHLFSEKLDTLEKDLLNTSDPTIITEEKKSHLQNLVSTAKTVSIDAFTIGKNRTAKDVNNSRLVLKNLEAEVKLYNKDASDIINAVIKNELSLPQPKPGLDPATQETIKDFKNKIEDLLNKAENIAPIDKEDLPLNDLKILKATINLFLEGKNSDGRNIELGAINTAFEAIKEDATKTLANATNRFDLYDLKILLTNIDSLLEQANKLKLKCQINKNITEEENIEKNMVNLKKWKSEIDLLKSGQDTNKIEIPKPSLPAIRKKKVLEFSANIINAKKLLDRIEQQINIPDYRPLYTNEDIDEITTKVGAKTKELDDYRQSNSKVFRKQDLENITEDLTTIQQLTKKLKTSVDPQLNIDPNLIRAQLDVISQKIGEYDKSLDAAKKTGQFLLDSIPNQETIANQLRLDLQSNVSFLNKANHTALNARLLAIEGNFKSKETLTADDVAILITTINDYKQNFTKINSDSLWEEVETRLPFYLNNIENRLLTIDRYYTELTSVEREERKTKLNELLKQAQEIQKIPNEDLKNKAALAKSLSDGIKKYDKEIEEITATEKIKIQKEKIKFEQRIKNLSLVYIETIKNMDDKTYQPFSKLFIELGKIEHKAKNAKNMDELKVSFEELITCKKKIEELSHKPTKTVTLSPIEHEKRILKLKTDALRERNVRNKEENKSLLEKIIKSIQTKQQEVNPANDERKQKELRQELAALKRQLDYEGAMREKISEQEKAIIAAGKDTGETPEQLTAKQKTLDDLEKQEQALQDKRQNVERDNREREQQEREVLEQARAEGKAAPVPLQPETDLASLGNYAAIYNVINKITKADDLALNELANVENNDEDAAAEIRNVIINNKLGVVDLGGGLTKEDAFSLRDIAIDIRQTLQKQVTAEKLTRLNGQLVNFLNLAKNQNNQLTPSQIAELQHPERIMNDLTVLLGAQGLAQNDARRGPLETFKNALNNRILDAKQVTDAVREVNASLKPPTLPDDLADSLSLAFKKLNNLLIQVRGAQLSLDQLTATRDELGQVEQYLSSNIIAQLKNRKLNIEPLDKLVAHLEKAKTALSKVIDDDTDSAHFSLNRQLGALGEAFKELEASKMLPNEVLGDISSMKININALNTQLNNAPPPNPILAKLNSELSTSNDIYTALTSVAGWSSRSSKHNDLFYHIDAAKQAIESCTMSPNLAALVIADEKIDSLTQHIRSINPPPLAANDVITALETREQPTLKYETAKSILEDLNIALSALNDQPDSSAAILRYTPNVLGKIIEPLKKLATDAVKDIDADPASFGLDAANCLVALQKSLVDLKNTAPEHQAAKVSDVVAAISNLKAEINELQNGDVADMQKALDITLSALETHIKDRANLPAPDSTLDEKLTLLEKVVKNFGDPNWTDGPKKAIEEFKKIGKNFPVGETRDKLLNVAEKLEKCCNDNSLGNRKEATRAIDALCEDPNVEKNKSKLGEKLILLPNKLDNIKPKVEIAAGAAANAAKYILRTEPAKTLKSDYRGNISERQNTINYVENNFERQYRGIVARYEAAAKLARRSDVEIRDLPRILEECKQRREALELYLVYSDHKGNSRATEKIIELLNQLNKTIDQYEEKLTIQKPVTKLATFSDESVNIKQSELVDNPNAIFDKINEFLEGPANAAGNAGLAAVKKPSSLPSHAKEDNAATVNRIRISQTTNVVTVQLTDTNILHTNYCQKPGDEKKFKDKDWAKIAVIMVEQHRHKASEKNKVISIKQGTPEKLTEAIIKYCKLNGFEFSDRTPYQYKPSTSAVNKFDELVKKNANEIYGKDMRMLAYSKPQTERAEEEIHKGEKSTPPRSGGNRP